MQVTSVDIEQIIRVVMERLATAGDLADGLTKIAAPTIPTSDLVLHERLITLGQIESQLEGKRRVRVSPRAVVTPAVRDLLRHKKIELLRESSSSEITTAQSSLAVASNTVASKDKKNQSAAASGHAPVLVCGSAIWFASLMRSLCPKQASVQAADDAVALSHVVNHKQRGGRCALWLTSQPFAAAVAAGRVADLAAVQLPSLRELSAALEQARPQLMIIDSTQWTVAAIGNLVRTLAKRG